MNNPDHFSEKQFFGLKYLNYLMRTWMEKIRIRDRKKIGSDINIPDPQ